MNHRGAWRKRYTVVIPNVGLITFATATIPGVPPAGKIIEVTTAKTGGSGLNVQTQIKEGVAGRMVVDTGAQLLGFPLAKTDIERQYTLSAQQALEVSVKVDIGADTTCSIDVVVEV